MVDNREKEERFNVKTMVAYVLKHYPVLAVSAVLGVFLMLVLNVVCGPVYSGTVVETDVISEADLEASRQSLKVNEENLAKLQKQLEAQEQMLSEYQDGLSEYEKRWDEDIYTKTSPENRRGIRKLYQFSGQNDAIIDEMLNWIGTALNSMNTEVSEKLEGELTALSVGRLVQISVSTSSNQILLTVSGEKEENARKLVEVCEQWFRDRMNVYQDKYPEVGLDMTAVSEEQYVYYDVNIFNEQRAASDKRVALQNGINSMASAVTATKNQMIEAGKQVEAASALVRKNESLWNNTIVVSQDKMVSKSSFLLYTLLGILLGLVLGSIALVFKLLYGTKLRDMGSLGYLLDGNLIGSLYKPIYRPGKDLIARKLDRWIGLEEDADLDAQAERLAMAIQMRLRKKTDAVILITGTVDMDVLSGVYDQIAKWLPEKLSVKQGGNPVEHIETMRMMMEADAVIVVEKVGVSKVGEIRRLMEYLSDNHMEVLGGVAV